MLASRHSNKYSLVSSVVFVRPYFLFIYTAVCVRSITCRIGNTACDTEGTAIFLL